ncbi:MAG: S8 family serine peptidase [Massilia sp.]
MPSLNVPQIGPLPTERLGQRADRLLARVELPELAPLRLNQVTGLLRAHRAELETDPRGEPIVRRELLAFSPTPAALDKAAAAGMPVLRRRVLDGLDEVMVVLQVPEGMGSAEALALLRAGDPEGSYDFNHIYTGSGGTVRSAMVGGAAIVSTVGGAAGVSTVVGATGVSTMGGAASVSTVGGAASVSTMSGAATVATVAGAAAVGAPPAAPRKRGQHAVGLVDSGVDAAHEVFDDAGIRRWGCDDQPHPSEHGTAVAALMVGRAEHFRGVAPDALLYAADIYCDSPTGGSAERIAGALGWMARQQVAVINLSLVGPSNVTLGRVVAAMVQRGYLLVAAVGNDGPAAPPLFPASYPGVVGVSAVDRQGRTLAEAARGPQVMFAAPGNNMVSAAPGAPPYRQVRGTSFAAPIVAALLAGQLDAPDREAARRALAALASQASGAAAEQTGLGIVGQKYRIEPSSMR